MRSRLLACGLDCLADSNGLARADWHTGMFRGCGWGCCLAECMQNLCMLAPPQVGLAAFGVSFALQHQKMSGTSIPGNQLIGS